MKKPRAYDVYFADAKIGRTSKSSDLFVPMEEARSLAHRHLVEVFRHMRPTVWHQERSNEVMDLIEGHYGSVGFFAELSADGTRITVAMRFDVQATKRLYGGYWTDCQVVPA